MSSSLLILAVAVLLLAELKSSQRGIWLAKPIASTLFVITALMADALLSFYGHLILLGLLLSWLGDVFLIPKRRLFFALGLVSFLLAHLAYAGAFLQQTMDWTSLAIASVAMIIFAIVVIRWLWPHLPAGLRWPVVAYLLAISLMVVLACGTIKSMGPLLTIGAVLFAVSDLFVARNRFIEPAVSNRLWGLPLYYAAQLIFALSVHNPF
ncbi:MAG: lysoplasmalogenase [Gammaproteobacteria bacterium]